jgi:hypothetical protein
MATRLVTTSDLLAGHVSLDIECLDRIYLNGYVPNLQVGGHPATLFAAPSQHHCAQPTPPNSCLCSYSTPPTTTDHSARNSWQPHHQRGGPRFPGQLGLSLGIRWTPVLGPISSPRVRPNRRLAQRLNKVLVHTRNSPPGLPTLDHENITAPRRVGAEYLIPAAKIRAYGSTTQRPASPGTDADSRTGLCRTGQTSTRSRNVNLPVHRRLDGLIRWPRRSRLGAGPGTGGVATGDVTAGSRNAVS